MVHGASGIKSSKSDKRLVEEDLEKLIKGRIDGSCKREGKNFTSFKLENFVSYEI